MAVQILKSLIILFFSVLIISCEEEVVETGINSIKLSGENYLEIANSTSLKSIGEEGFTIEIWASGGTDIPGVAQALFMVGNNNGGDEIGIYQIPGDSNLVIIYIDNNLFGVIDVPGLDWSAGELHYLTLVKYNKSVGFYFDGKPIFISSIPNLDVDIGASNILIGADYDAPGINANVGNFWVGSIDEVRLWKRHLTSTDIEKHYQHPDKITIHYSVEMMENLVGLWRFNRESSDMVPDDSGNDNDAFIRGSGQVTWEK